MPTLHRIFAGAFLVLAAIAFLPFSVQARETEDGKTGLLLWGVGPRERPKGARRPAPNYVKVFQDQNPDISVIEGSSLRIEGGPGEGAELMAIAGGTAPDVFDLFGRKLQTYADGGFLANLDPFLEEYERETGHPYEGIFAPAAIWEACKYNGSYVGVPRAFYTMQLYWRKDFLRRAGVDPDIAPANWDELFKVGMALTEPEGEVVIAGKRMKGSRYGFILYGYAWPFMNFIWSAGGEVVRPYTKCSGCGELVELPNPRIDYRADHIRVRDDDFYYAEGLDEHTECGKCGTTVVEHRIEDEILANPERKIEWRVTFNEPKALDAFSFYGKLIHQPWTRCATPHPGDEPDEFEITPEMERAGQATCPVCGANYTISTLNKSGKLYRGIATVMRETDPDLLDQFVRGRAAMMICWSGVAEGLVAKGLSKELVGQAPMPPGPGGRRANFIAGGFYAINAQTDPESQKAAWKYITFMTGKEVGAMSMRHAVESGIAQFGWPSDLVRYGFTDVLREIPRSWIDIEPEILKNARVEPYCPGFQHVYERLKGPLEKIEREPALDIKKEADALAHYINTQIMGEPTAEEVKKKNLIAGGLAIVLLAFFAFMFVRAIRALSSAAKSASVQGGPVQSRSAKLRMLAYSTAFLGLAVGLILVWRYIPLLLGTQMAFYDWQLVGQSRFIGLQNFSEALYSREFWMTMYRTVLYVAISLGMGFFAPIALALLLHEVPRGKMLFRTIYYLPAVTSGLITMFLWKRAIYDPTENGILNKVWLGVANSLVDVWNWITQAGLAHAKPLLWLQDPNLAMICIVITGVWAGAGPGCLIYLAALKGVPEEEYEAAEIDGAGLLHKIFFVTFPNLSALIIINFVGAFIGSFQAMQNIFVMTGGGPANSTYTIGIDIWYNAFMYLKFGYATAMAWILGSLLIGFTVQQLQILRKVEFKAHGSSAV